jgi:Protein of unknown function (DUF993)
MAQSVRLPCLDGTIRPYTASTPQALPSTASPVKSRIAYAAVHVVADPLAHVHPTLESAVDWDLTLAYRRHIYGLGLAVAEAMDTAQRGMGMSWEATRELIRRSLGDARATPGARIGCGVTTDQLSSAGPFTLEQVETAYEEQIEWVERHGGQVILMASRALATCARGPEDYVRVYGKLLRQVSRPVIIHWLGDMFDPALEGYWGSPSLDVAMEVLLGIVREHAPKVDGVKLSLLDQKREIVMRRQFPAGVHMYSGDDFDYPTTIRGDEHGYSDALLGIFDVIAPAASAALHALDAGNLTRYEEILRPTLPLSRHLFGFPTRFYKTGVVFMAYLNGHQGHFRMVGGLESARSIVHLAEIFRLADQAGLLRDPDLATARMRRVLAVAGLD